MTPTTSSTMAEPTHPCVRCGAPVAPGIGLCERCNPLGLRDTASSQVHGSVFIAVAIAVIGLAVFARMSFAGVGPFDSSIDGVESAAGGLAVTITVRNAGEAAGQTTCQVAGEGRSGGAEVLLAPRLDPGEERTFQRTLTKLGTTVRPLVIECRTP